MTPKDRSDRSLPTFVTLLVVAILLMTVDVRLSGEGVVGVMRGGTQTLIAPMQRAATLVVDPVSDFLDSLTEIASLREQVGALRAELAEAQRLLAENEEKLARLETLERLLGLDLVDAEVALTVANVIGRPDQFNLTFLIDKGTTNGVIEGQPVVDSFGFAVGVVTEASPHTALVVPILDSRNRLEVLTGSQAGLLSANPALTEMTLDIFDARDPVQAGDQVVTAAGAFPAGLAVGEIIEAAEPVSTALTARVRPFVEPGRLRVVAVLAWPPDPTAATTTTTTTTTVPPDDDITDTTDTTVGESEG
ncbi:hypothetical protein BH23ACT5_BH23ACT5_06040 [soil metagenome]